MAKFSYTNIPINPYWPAVIARIRRNVQYFPMELLEVAPNQRVSLEKQFIVERRLAVDNPTIRFNKIRDMLEALNLHDSGLKNKFLQAFGVVVANHPKKVVGFRRPAPQIVFKEERSCKIDKLNYSWSPEWNSKFVEVCSVDRIIIVHSEKNSGLINNMIDALKQMFKCRGIRCREFVDIFIRNSGISGREGQLENVFKENAGSQVTILIIYIDRVASNSHDFLKLMERKYLIPTQQITTEVAYKLPRQSKTCANFVSKTNLKLGGVNYEVIPEPFAKNRWIMDGKTLFVGYDVAHPGKPTRDEIVNKSPPQMPSVVGVTITDGGSAAVFVLDNTLFLRKNRWIMDGKTLFVGYDVAHPGKPARDEIVKKSPPQMPSVVGFSFNGAVHPGNFIGDYHFQSPRKEEVEALVLIARFKWILSTFVKNREVWPESVVITRDGISEGQYGMVIENELKAVRYACQDFAKSQGRESWTPFFTVIVVTKRHNSRFFVDNKRLENPKPATVVDTDVVRNDITEFYLQSHKAVQGTAKSTCYQILFDENNISMDEAQSLMLALTFNHQICDMPVSLPEPIYQADEWAKRGRNTWMALTKIKEKSDCFVISGAVSDYNVTCIMKSKLFIANKFRVLLASCRHNVIFQQEKGNYSKLPIDFEAMTKRLSFWNTKLQDRRLNA
ncbi:piwi domain protein [Dictyocaulus viviparus]|uniref:Piwi domain protein n=1 Tax=Dictyocaulus viviparus TaxID=29172 RepID=A0A0D8Y0B4_DICVI|nr:piwi domain protein [Dictyocaulus viviparus]